MTATSAQHNAVHGTVLARAVTDDEAWLQLPVGMRAAIAAAVMAAEGRRVSANALAEAARYSRSTAIRAGGPWNDAIKAIVAQPHGLLQRLELPDLDHPTAPQLHAELQQARATIGELRAQLAEAKAAVKPLADYANDVSAELRRWRDDERAALDAKVAPLRIVTDDGTPEDAT